MLADPASGRSLADEVLAERHAEAGAENRDNERRGCVPHAEPTPVVEPFAARLS